MKFQKIITWTLLAALLFQCIPVSSAFAETISTEEIYVENGDVTEAVDITEAEENPVSVSADELTIGAEGIFPVSISGNASVSAPDGTEDKYEHKFGHVDSGLEVTNPENIEGLTGADFEEKYISPYITAVHNQSGYGTCWAFAATSVIEASMVKHNGADKKTLDLSDLATAYYCVQDSYDIEERFGNDSMVFIQNDSDYNQLLDEKKREYPEAKVEGQKIANNLGYLNKGGNAHIAMQGLAHWNGLIPESSLPYPVNDQYEDHSEAIRLTNELENDTKDEKRIAILQDAISFKMSDSNLVKAMLKEYGAIYVSFRFEDDYYNKETCSYYQNETTSTNHAVTLVGWDDNYARENFKSTCRPSSNGAWILKNSWGTNWGTSIEEEGERGYFYISYEDAVLSLSDAHCFLVNDVDTYDHNYQYDGTTTTSSYQFNRPEGVYSANVYTVENDSSDEILNAVGITTGANVEYTIEIYKNPERDKNGIIQNPQTGTKIGEVSGKQDFFGYHTVPVSCNETLKKGDLFSVVLHQKTNAGNLHVYVDIDSKADSPTHSIVNVEDHPEEKILEYYGRYCTDSDSMVGQSFMNYGYGWTDIRYMSSIGYNLRLKAFTSDVCRLRVSENSVKLHPGETCSQEIKVVRGEPGGSFTYTSSDETVATVDASGHVTAIGAGTAFIKAQVPEGAFVQYKVIVKNALSQCTVSAIDIQQYTGKAIFPSVDVFYKDELLVHNVDYTISARNNVRVGTASLRITGRGKYDGNIDTTFEITDEKLSVTMEGTRYTYTGSEIKPLITVSQNNALLTEGKDYTVKYQGNVNAGIAYLTVKTTAKPVSMTKKFMIRPADISDVIFEEIPAQPLKGGAAKPQIKASYQGNVLRAKKDYRISYKNNRKAAIAKELSGDPQAIVAMKGNFTGNTSLHFSIVDKSEGEIDLSRASVSNIVSSIYSGRRMIQQPCVRLKNVPLTEGQDYYLTYSGKSGEGDNINAGKVTVLIHGCGKYKGTIKKTFTIKSSPITSPEFSISLSDYSFSYTGTEVKPTVIFKDGSGKDIPESEYTVTYKRNQKCGTGKAVIKVNNKRNGGSGNLKGSKTLYFAIAEEGKLLPLKDLEKIYPYTGAVIMPDKDNKNTFYGTDGTACQIGREWKVKYYNNKNAGEAIAILTGKGANRGKMGVCRFTIGKQTASALEIAGIPAQKLKGKALYPKVTVKNGNKKLKAGTDYTAYYYDNTEKGAGNITLQFHGNYEGIREDIMFRIQ